MARVRSRSPILAQVWPAFPSQHELSHGFISAKTHTWLLCHRHTQFFPGPASVVCPDVTPLAPDTAGAPDAPGAAVALPYHLQYGSQDAAKEALGLKGIQKRMAKLDRDIQLAKIRFATKGGA
ncbi:hypothetical protein BZA77DRAFT_363067 [Pyronema omphalodes]|nr:hypothetical protein BZA77DRAFT_363067 [Pyronema omphalodes]